jgi:hypothetical protein
VIDELSAFEKTLRIASIEANMLQSGPVRVHHIHRFRERRLRVHVGRVQALH